jgi:septal ring factor EnvC (AmiA/AmiB activator)
VIADADAAGRGGLARIQQQAHLAQALKAAYQRGQGDALKLVLNGADPNQTARDLRYLAHLSRAQLAMIEALRADLAQLAALQLQTAQKSTELTQLQAARAEQQQLLADKARASRCCKSCRCKSSSSGFKFPI